MSLMFTWPSYAYLLKSRVNASAFWIKSLYLFLSSINSFFSAYPPRLPIVSLAWTGDILLLEFALYCSLSSCFDFEYDDMSRFYDTISDLELFLLYLPFFKQGSNLLLLPFFLKLKSSCSRAKRVNSP